MIKTGGFLYDYQEAAVEECRDGCILNGGVGSGKSRTGLYYYFYTYGGSIDADRNYTPMRNPGKLYIITTAKKRNDREWDLECAPFGFTDYVVDSWNNIKKYVNVTDAFFMFDEDKITGKGAWVKAFLKITKNNRWIILSATPGDNWEQYAAVFVANGFFRNRTHYMNEHAVITNYGGYPQISKWIGVDILEEYRRRILIDMNVSRNTTRHHVNVICNYDKEVYKRVMKDRWDIYKEEPIQQASVLCYILRRICNEDEDRQARLLELISENDIDRAIIFYNFDYELDILKSLDYGEGYKVAEYNGHKHEKIPDSKKWIYLVNYGSGAEGWNCILTDTIIFYSQTYSYKTLEQACGRTDRVNTKFTDLYYYHLRSQSSIDLMIKKALLDKKEFNILKFAGK